MSFFHGKRILLGVSGGIAAYKTPELVRAFIKQGAEVRVIMTPSSKDFVTPLSLATCTCKKSAVTICVSRHKLAFF